MSSHCTTKSTQAEIVAEAKRITAKERQAAEDLRALLLSNLRKSTGLNYGCQVSKARYQLVIVDYSGKKIVVTEKCEPMPFYQFNEFLLTYKHSEA